MRRSNSIAVCCCMALLVVAGGCKKDRGAAAKPPEPTAGPGANLPLDDLVSLASSDREAGNTNAAIERLLAGLDDARYQFQWPAIITDLIYSRIEQGDMDAARANYLAATKRNPQIAAAGLALLAQGGQELEAFKAHAAWCEAALEQDLSNSVIRLLYSGAMNGYHQTQDTNSMWKVFAKGMELGKIDAATATITIRPIIVTSYQSGQTALLDEYVALVRGRYPDQKPLAALATHAELAVVKGEDYLAALELLESHKDDLEQREITDYRREFAGRALDGRDDATVQRILNLEPGLQSFVIERRISAHNSGGRLDDARRLLAGDGKTLAPGTRARLVSGFVLAVAKKQGPAAALTEAEGLFAENAGVIAVQQSVLREATKIESESKNGTGVANWLERAEKADLPANLIAQTIRATAYGILNAGTPADLQRILDVGMRIRETAGEIEQGTLGAVLLDLSFTLGQHEASIRLLESGVPGRDEEWTSVMLNKVRAHHAMDSGRLDEAIERFQVFMASLQEAGEDPYDPVAGEKVPIEMVLGFNEKRIGDLYAKQGKPDMVAEHYNLARAMYAKALERAETDTVTARIKEESADVPRP